MTMYVPPPRNSVAAVFEDPEVATSIARGVAHILDNQGVYIYIHRAEVRAHYDIDHFMLRIRTWLDYYVGESRSLQTLAYDFAIPFEAFREQIRSNDPVGLLREARVRKDIFIIEATRVLLAEIFVQNQNQLPEHAFVPYNVGYHFADDGRLMLSDVPPMQRAFTPEALAEAEELARRARQRQEEKEEARKKAEQLLEEVLSPDELTQYKTKGTITVRGPTSRLIYEIHRKRSNSVKVYGLGGEYIKTLCAVPAASIPIEDQMLAIKLMIETDERTFNKIAFRGY